MPTFVTTVTRSYLPLARTLMASIAEQHPDSRRIVLLLDGIPGDTADAEIMTMSDLIADADERMVLQGIYKPIELATALKPKLLKRALETDTHVLFLDPDMRLLQPADAAIEALDSGTGTLLTPHRIQAPTQEYAAFFEWALKVYGTYNTGFVAVTERSMPFLDWWDSRLRRDCLDDLEAPEWVDQRIVDLAPAYFDLDIFKHPGYNVGWWNFEERPITDRDGTWYAGEVPLTVMHFSGVRPIIRSSSELPQLAHSARNSIVHDAAMLAEIRKLEVDYVERLFAAGYKELAGIPYPYAVTAGGHTLSQADRRAYRRLVLEAEANGAPVPTPDDLPWGRVAQAVRTAQLQPVPRVLVKSLKGNGSVRSVVNRLRARAESR
jgi:hypothetical protein